MERKLLDAITEGQNAITLLDRGRTKRNINKSLDYMIACVGILIDIRNDLDIQPKLKRPKLALDKPK
jgi:hypothetical protein